MKQNMYESNKTGISSHYSKSLFEINERIVQGFMSTGKDDSAMHESSMVVKKTYMGHSLSFPVS